MSNVKRVQIEGAVPFNLNDYGVMQPFLAGMNSPTINLKIEYSREAVEMRPNEHGGQTAMYRFKVSGREAVSYGWAEAFKAAVIEIGGEVTVSKIKDVEGQLV
jgi:hypothetical protein